MASDVAHDEARPAPRPRRRPPRARPPTSRGTTSRSTTPAARNRASAASRHQTRVDAARTRSHTTTEHVMGSADGAAPRPVGVAHGRQGSLRRSQRVPVWTEFFPRRGARWPRTTRRARAGPALRGAACAVVTGAALVLAACGAPPVDGPPTGAAPCEPPTGRRSSTAAHGQEVSLWMYGGDTRGNAYVDDVLAPAAAGARRDLRRVPVADTQDASEPGADRAPGRTGRRQRRPRVGERRELPQRPAGRRLARAAGRTRCRTRSTSTRRTRCSPRTSARPSRGVSRRGTRRSSSSPTTAPTCRTRRRRVQGVLDWAEQNPGRFTYPAPPDFTGSAFLRQALYGVAGGPQDVPADFDGPPRRPRPLWERLAASRRRCGARGRRTRATWPSSRTCTRETRWTSR